MKNKEKLLSSSNPASVRGEMTLNSEGILELCLDNSTYHITSLFSRIASKSATKLYQSNEKSIEFIQGGLIFQEPSSHEPANLQVIGIHPEFYSDGEIQLFANLVDRESTYTPSLKLHFIFKNGAQALGIVAFTEDRDIQRLWMSEQNLCIERGEFNPSKLPQTMRCNTTIVADQIKRRPTFYQDYHHLTLSSGQWKQLENYSKKIGEDIYG